jgi:hypothetical protein
MYRLITFSVVLLWSISALSHHWVRDVYDGEKRLIIDAEVKKFDLIHPHPMMLVEITGVPEGQETYDLAIGQTWTVEMDNRRELTALGIHAETFIPGDTIRVAVDPSFNTSYRDNTLYMRAVEHPREGFVYIHNVRQLFPIDAAEDSLLKHLPKIN